MPDEKHRPYAVVTVADVYGQQRELAGKVEAALARQQQNAARLDDHETRLRSLEAWRYALPLSTISAIIAALAAVATTIFG
ncbi:hypothetical protein [Nocardiopsis oceani]